MKNRAENGIIWIYGLRIPGTEEIRYIGQTADTTRRLAQHLHDTVTHPRSYLHRWIQSVLKAGQVPELVRLEQTTEDGWAEAEARWIQEMRRRGDRLVNLTDGGEGCSGYRHPPEVRAKISAALKGRPTPPRTEEQRAQISEANRGRTHSPETRAKMGAAHKGKVVSAETRAKIAEENKLRAGRPKSGPAPSKEYQRSAEWRARIGEANRRRKLSDGTKQRISEANSGRAHSEETKLRMGQRYEVSYNNGPWEPMRNMSRFVADMNLNKCMMYRVLHGTAPHHKGWRIRRPET